MIHALGHKQGSRRPVVPVSCDDNPARSGIATVGVGWEEMPTSTAARSNSSQRLDAARVAHLLLALCTLVDALGTIDSITATVAARAVSDRGDAGVRFQQPALLRWPRVGGVEVG